MLLSHTVAKPCQQQQEELEKPGCVSLTAFRI